MKPRITSLLLVIAFAHPALAQKAGGDNSAQNSPLTVTAIFAEDSTAGCPAESAFALQMRYSGKQPLRGYVVEVTLSGVARAKQFLKAEPFRRVIQRAINVPGMQLIQPGDRWTDQVCNVPHDLAVIPTDAVPRVDVLKFADGTIWGGASLPESNELLGMFEGIDFITALSPEQGPVTPTVVSNAAPQGGKAQDPAVQTFGPLSFTPRIDQDPSGGKVVIVETRNNGPVPVRGFVYALIFYGPNYSKMRQVTTKQIESHGDPAAYLTAGTVWLAPARKATLLDDGSAAQCKIQVDLILFADGSTQGLMQSNESHELMGIARGIDIAKGRPPNSSPASR